MTHHAPPDTPLMQAALDGDTAAVEALLESNAEAAYTNSGGYSALVWAAYAGHGEIVSKLLDAGATINPPAFSHTPIRGASIRGDVAIVKDLLTRRADVNIPSAGGRTALMGASMAGHDDVLELLVEARGDVHPVNDFGEDALTLAKTSLAKSVLLQQQGTESCSGRDAARHSVNLAIILPLAAFALLVVAAALGLLSVRSSRWQSEWLYGRKAAAAAIGAAAAGLLLALTQAIEYMAGEAGQNIDGSFARVMHLKT